MGRMTSCAHYTFINNQITLAVFVRRPFHTQTHTPTNPLIRGLEGVAATNNNMTSISLHFCFSDGRVHATTLKLNHPRPDNTDESWTD